MCQVLGQLGQSNELVVTGPALQGLPVLVASDNDKMTPQMHCDHKCPLLLSPSSFFFFFLKHWNFQKWLEKGPLEYLSLLALSGQPYFHKALTAPTPE